jgi:glycosyltransferase involved in cell wall biosynthesis
MRMWYRSMDFLVQPSRAEAFGICPVEARAAGTPVIMTNCTGHREHYTEDDVSVVHGKLAPITVNGIPNGAAPTVEPSAICAALEQAKRLNDLLQKAAYQRADSYYYLWTWSVVTKDLAEVLGRLLKRSGGKTLEDKLGV